jgi:hypothetical protein
VRYVESGSMVPLMLLSTAPTKESTLSNLTECFAAVSRP